MINSTALFTEFLVIGTAAWLWMLPLVQLTTRRGVVELAQMLNGASVVLLGALVLITYALGVITESLSFALEKAAVGRTSNPRQWYLKHVARLTSEDWHAAQERIWVSEFAYNEFSYSRLRVSISRGIFANAVIGFVLAFLSYLARMKEEEFLYIALASAAFAVLALISWWVATVEYNSRVQVASELALKDSL